jgi:hypothetical protein
MGWAAFIKHLQFPSDCTANLHALSHSAGSYLHRLATNGVPAPSSSPPWSKAMLRTALRRGAHASAKFQFREFLHEDLLDMVSKGYWTLLPFSAVQHYTHLKLPPCGVVPQRTRRPHPIVDYSFTTVNRDSLPLAPLQAMQIGHAFQRILQHIAYANPSHGPPLMQKLDLADGYYRVRLTPQAALELAVVLPGLSPRSTLIGFPLSIPMGWKSSPPYFCAFTETAADMANAWLTRPKLSLPPHPLVHSSQAHDVPRETKFYSSIVHPPTVCTSAPPLAWVDVYIDDFISIAQAPRTYETLNSALHSISSIFRHEPHASDRSARKQTISASKLASGDGAWSTKKQVLGWNLDTAAGTLNLPDHKAATFLELIQHFLPLHRTSRKKWYSLLGHLRHVSMAIKGAQYLFSILQSVLVDQPASARVRISPLVRHALQDWLQLATSLHQTPIPISSLVPQAPQHVGASDASLQGLGGWWIPTTFSSQHPPMVFRHPFQTSIQTRLVSHTNLTGDINNSDLELAALIMAAAILTTETPTAPHAHLYCGSDNAATVAWATKGSTSSTSHNAHLLRWLAQLTRHRLFSLTPIFVSGTTNSIADFCSRSFHLSDDEFLQEMNCRFPITPSWTLAHPTNEMISDMNFALSPKMSPPAYQPLDPMPLAPHGNNGSTSASPSTPTQHYNKQKTQSYSSNFLPIVTVGASYLPARLQSAVAQWVMPFAPLARRLPTWDSPTLGCSRLVN